LRPIAQIKKSRNDLSLLLVTAIIFSLGINLLSTSIYELIGHMPISFFAATVVLIIAFYLANKLLGAGQYRKINLPGAVAFIIKDDEIIKKPIYSYEFNDDFIEYLVGFLNENMAYKKAFIKTNSDKIKKGNTLNLDQVDYYSIMNSVCELMFLKQLDYHLNSYFVENEIESNKIKCLERSDLGSNILKNRVIDLITKDMCEREAFINDGDDPDEGVVYSHSGGKNGAIYERISLELPPGCSLDRNEKGYLVINSKIFKMTFRPKFEGFATFISPELTKYDDEYYSPLFMSAYLDLEVKNRMWVSHDEIELYEWLDSFLIKIEEYFSTVQLEQRVNLTLLRALRS